MYEITILKADGTVETDTTDTPPDFRYLQKAVGGLIETVPYFEAFEGNPCVAFCNEEGKMNGLQINDIATMKWAQQFDRPINDILVGDVIIICGSPEELAKL